MTDQPTNEKKGRRVTFEWTREEVAALEEIAQIDPFVTLGASRRAIVRYLILMYAQKAKEEEMIPATRADIDELMSLMRGIAMIARNGSIPAQTSVPGKRGPKPKEAAAQEAADERIEDGMNICQALGGVNTGSACVYKKYEVMATGRPVEFDVTVPLASLGGSHIALQFDPSRELYDRAVREYRDTE